MEKIGILGGSGFVGSSLAKYLSKSFEVKVLDISPPSKSLQELVRFIKCDIRRYSKIHEGLHDVDVVIHAAIVQIPMISEQKKLGYEVNVLGTQYLCRAVEENSNIRGMILAGSWHTIGERNIIGVVDEEFGFRPDKVEERARLYALSKIAQESIVRLYDEMSEKIYGIIRMGTVLGEGMPKETAANIFIEKGLRGEPITPFRHSMYRPMLYVDIKNVCRAYEVYALKILNGECEKSENSLAHIVNVYYPRPITILRLAEIVKNCITNFSHGKFTPRIEIVDKGLPILFGNKDVKKIKVDISKARNYLGMRKLCSPQESINRIIRTKLSRMQTTIERYRYGV